MFTRSQSDLHVFGQKEETGEPGGNPCEYGGKRETQVHKFRIRPTAERKKKTIDLLIEFVMETVPA